MKIESSELRRMIADYMENGFLENIIDMFKHDKSPYAFTGKLMADERVRLIAKEAVEDIKKQET